MTRTEDFNDGAATVRAPAFQSVQQQANRHFQALSVLDTPSVIPNQNGMGAADRQRRIMGMPQATGRSESTYDSQIWLRTAQPSPSLRPKEE